MDKRRSQIPTTDFGTLLVPKSEFALSDDVGGGVERMEMCTDSIWSFLVLGSAVLGCAVLYNYLCNTDRL